MNTSRIIDPNSFFHSPTGKQWQKVGVKDHHGLVIPLFSLHSAQSCGIGEYPDILPLVDWCRSIGFDILQFLPLNDTGLGSSPYSALSAFALHPIYLGLSALPYLDQYADLQTALKDLQKESPKIRLDYPAVWHKKKQFLKQYYKQAGYHILNSQAYKDFIIRNNSWLKGFAVFKTLKTLYQSKSWEEWPFEIQHPTPQLIEQLSIQYQDEVNFHCMAQFLCNQQLHAVKTHAEAHHINLMGDIPILTCRDSADVWLNRELFELKYSAGAPPDYFNLEGQNWGFPLYNWARIAESNYKWWIDRLQTAANYYQLYRIDHIVGFFRIWAIPQNLTSKDGFFIPHDQFLWIEHGGHIMRMMIENCDMLPIGEDLGVVPPEVRACLSKLGICGTRVIRWERDWLENKNYIPFDKYALDSMTTVSTHDCETLKLWWKEYPEEAKLFAQFKNWSYQPILNSEYQKQILYDSHHSNSLFHINLLQEYLSLIPELSWPNIEDDRINIPGTFSEYNWTYRFRPSVEEIVQNERLKELIQELIS